MIQEDLFYAIAVLYVIERLYWIVKKWSRKEVKMPEVKSGNSVKEVIANNAKKGWISTWFWAAWMIGGIFTDYRSIFISMIAALVVPTILVKTGQEEFRKNGARILRLFSMVRATLALILLYKHFC